MGRNAPPLPTRRSSSRSPGTTAVAAIVRAALELSALRIFGLVLGALLAAFAIWRRRTLRNGDMLLLLVSALGLILVSGTDLLDAVLEFFSFERGNGGRILGLAVFAVMILFL